MKIWLQYPDDLVPLCLPHNFEFVLIELRQFLIKEINNDDNLKFALAGLNCLAGLATIWACALIAIVFSCLENHDKIMNIVIILINPQKFFFQHKHKNLI